MTTPNSPNSDAVYALIDYKDDYVQPLILRALKSRFPRSSSSSSALVLLDSLDQLPAPEERKQKLLQWTQYEDLDLERATQRAPATTLINSYVIRKALIRKHYLAHTVAQWRAKQPGSTLAAHVAPGVAFELDFAEFLDDALVEAYELREAFARNAAERDPARRQWWILKPGMSDRGQGIRLFSSEDELVAIFEEWDPPSDDDDDDDDDDEEDDDEAAHFSDDDDEDKVSAAAAAAEAGGGGNSTTKHKESNTGIITSQLRHFVAQPYIHPPLLLPAPFPSADRKFHIRTYVLAVGALRVHVYKPMLALFAANPYTAPWNSNSNSNSDSDNDAGSDPNANLAAHLTNTCLQTGEREGSVHAFWSLPDNIDIAGGGGGGTDSSSSSSSSNKTWKQTVFSQICSVTAQVFEAAARGMMVHFQPLANAFEIFGLDFLVDAAGKASLLEVNAFPDFAQTGAELNGLIEGLFEEVVDVGVKPFFFGSEGEDEDEDEGRERMVKVLDIDLGRG